MTTLSESHEKTRADLEAANVRVGELGINLADANYELEALQTSVDGYEKSLTTLKAKLKKICSAKPKPKGC
jgi:predicted  nucleic acid-binding Zn-ribbon protein